jgi:ribosome assembly protein YihI (activator of Der GTPase)
MENQNYDDNHAGDFRRSGGYDSDDDVDVEDDLRGIYDSNSLNNSDSNSNSNTDSWQGIESGFYFEEKEKATHRRNDNGRNVTAMTASIMMRQEKLQTDMVSRIRGDLMARLTLTRAVTSTALATREQAQAIPLNGKQSVQIIATSDLASKTGATSSRGASNLSKGVKTKKLDKTRSGMASGSNVVNNDESAGNSHTQSQTQLAPKLLVYRQIPSGLSKRDFALKVRKEKQFKKRLELVGELNREFGYRKESTALLQSIQRG